jgi:aspartate dehydrogenase
VNIAAALALAGVGVERTVVRIVVDPLRTWHEHRITARGPFGYLDSTLSFPATETPDGQRVMAMSVLALLRKLTSRLSVGT